MSSLNKASLIGHVGQAPEIRSTQQGKRIANFSLATSEKWKDRVTGEGREATEWHRIVVFNERLVEVVEKYVDKGKQLYLEGKIKTRKWTDRDGQDRYSTEITLEDFGGVLVLLGGGNGGNRPPPADDAGEYGSPSRYGQARTAAASPPRHVGRDELDDEIPF
jgi:single-strand DNA-binding protein